MVIKASIKVYFLSNFKATDGLSHLKPFKSDFKKIIIIYNTRYFILLHFTNFKIDFCLYLPSRAPLNITYEKWASLDCVQSPLPLDKKTLSFSSLK